MGSKRPIWIKIYVCVAHFYNVPTRRFLPCNGVHPFLTKKKKQKRIKKHYVMFLHTVVKSVLYLHTGSTPLIFVRRNIVSEHLPNVQKARPEC